MIAAIALLSLAVDVGYLATLRCELKRSTDAAALAGAGVLVDGPEVAELQAFEFYARNPIGGRNLTGEVGWQDNLPSLLADNRDIFQVDFGQWDPASRTFTPSDVQPSSVRVRVTHRDASIFFARSFFPAPLVNREFGGITETVRDTNIDLQAESIARFQPRDIALVLDFSASMNDDSELRRVYEYGEQARATVEASLLQIYQELGSPIFGTMQFEPQYISSTNRSTIKNLLELTYVAYPYPSGSWDNYIDYVKSSSSYAAKAGYYKKYGYLTLVNYWLERKPVHSQTPDLWSVSAQPVSAVKDAVGIFMAYIQQVDTHDQIALIVYNSPSQTALVEHSLTVDFATIQNTIAHRQAGHYDRFTNIGAGIQFARQELENNARLGAFKMVVLMTDGVANRPSADARGFAVQQAELVAANHWPIVTISLGRAADTALMQQIADITSGVHFNIPGDRNVTDFEADLKEVFARIADHRPLVLVK